ncbi:malectin domain-containing carbohydrate-binding protein [Mucilaginibacter sp.]|jgi:hypothetical protein|uniref:malectin domain-containing carbohydrate-binding protein n=1 Tax=Mucilaginibacter sp. TaxID=1882438 RepID=UPI003562D92F
MKTNYLLKKALYKQILHIIIICSFCYGKAYGITNNKWGVIYANNLSMADTCAPVSTLSCAAIKVSLPFNLNYNAGIAGTILDKNGLGTGFTTVNTYSGARLSADGQPTISEVPGYVPSKITVTGGQLQLVTNKGIDFLTNNNQLNILGVQINPVTKLQLEVKVINPFNGTQSQQAGLWYGLNDKTFIKLTIIGNKIELRKEINDVSSTTPGTSNPDQRATAVISGLNNQTVRLRMIIDSSTNSVEGFYSIDGVNYINVGSGYNPAGINIAGMGLATASTAYAGIYVTHRNATTAVTYNFDDFSATSIVVPVSQNVNINFQPGTAAVPAGYIADTGLPYDATRKYGWVDPVTKQPVNLQANMRLRSGTGDPKQLSLVQMQANTSGQVPGTWEYAVANGQYVVTVSAGDVGYYDSNNQINVEGLPTIADFSHTATTKYRTATAKVSVTDGKLTIDATGGANTKMNYLTFSPAATVTDVINPTASARFAGVLKSTNAYDGEVQVFLTAADTGGSGLALFQYSLNDGAYIDYKAPFVISTAGNYALKVKAVDGNNNETITSTYNFSVVAQATTGVYMVLKNLDNFPSDNRLLFSLIQTPWRRVSPDTTPYNANHDRVKLRVNSKGTGKLTISNIKLSNPSAWKIVSIGLDTLSQVPVSVLSKAFTDITIQFIAKDAASRLKVFTDTLTITSNDNSFPIKKVLLSGIWQKEGEGVNEPYAQQIINAFGFTSIVGYAHDDNGIEGKTRVPNSSEVNANYFVRVDNTKPVTVYQVAAYHGCCLSVESIRYFDKGSSSNRNVFTHNNLDGQSVLPRLIGSSTVLAQGSFTPTGKFGLRVGSSSTDRNQNVDSLIGIRILKAFDGQGNIIPNAYFLDCDYLGTPFTNYDYQDNIYYVENMRPDSGTVNYSELAVSPVTAVNFAPTQTGVTTTVPLTFTNTGKTYPNGTSDPAITLSSMQIVGPDAAEFAAGAFPAGTLNIQTSKLLNIKFVPTSVGIKNAALLINYNSAASPMRIPLYGIANSATSTVNAIKRIKSGSNSSVTIGNIPYESDVSYRKGSIKLDGQAIAGPIRSTDVDSLYQTYLSATADGAETRYEIPVSNGNYQVRMHFVENYFTGPGLRVFNTTIENQLVSSNFDIFSEVGYRTALVKDFNATVTDGVLTIKFNPTINRLALAAMELFQITNNSSLLASTVNTLITPPEVSSEKKIMVYPNPNNGSLFNLNLNNFAASEKVLVSVTNTWGKLMQSQSVITDLSGNASVTFPLNTVLSRGVYIINARATSGKLYTKLVVE